MNTRRRTQEKIKHLATFPQLNPNPIIELDGKGKITFANLSAIKTLQRLDAQKNIKLFLPKDIAKIIKNINAKPCSPKKYIREIQIKKSFFMETLIIIPELKAVRIYAWDITARKKVMELLRKAHNELEEKVLFRTRELFEVNKQLSQEVLKRQETEKQINARNVILRLLNKTDSSKTYLDGVVKLIRYWSQCRYVGIRVLEEEGNIPYYSHVNFSDDFRSTEDCLSIKTDNCACTRVIKGKTDPEDRPFMNNAGTFSCNDTFILLRNLPEQMKNKFRGICIENGFRSLAVIPIRHRDKIIGAIHLADKEPAKANKGVIEFIESLSGLIGGGINKFNLEERIRKGQNELEQASRLSDIGTLAATVAHELRNPLAAIGLASFNIKRKANNPDLDKHLANIEKKVSESEQIINNLLYYSRIKPPLYERVNLDGIINECVDMKKGQFRKKRIFFKVLAGKDKDTFIQADPLQIKEVFSNIINNACDAVSEQGGKIEISLTEEGKVAKVRIDDNGCGIGKECLSNVFDPFFTTKAKGTGLGLSVSQQIVNFHHGSISLESEPQKGTAVTVCLPKKT